MDEKTRQALERLTKVAAPPVNPDRFMCAVRHEDLKLLLQEVEATITKRLADPLEYPH